jgi:hypothetical protein
MKLHSLYPYPDIICCDFSFSQQQVWRWLSSWMLCHVVSYMSAKLHGETFHKTVIIWTIN